MQFSYETAPDTPKKEGTECKNLLGLHSVIAEYGRFLLSDSRPVNLKTKNQKGFKRILIMEYKCPGIGPVRLTVGQKGSDGTKVQYCITAIDAYVKK